MSFTTANEAVGGTNVLGWRFTTSTPITVFALGYYDSGGDGLLHNHDTGIFDSSGILLTEALVPPGTAGTLVDQYRYVSVTPITLQAGQTYTIAGVTNGNPEDPHAFGGNLTTGLMTASGITLQGAYFTNGNALKFPDTLDPSVSFYGGGNFLLTPIPEPTSLFLVGGLALGALGLVRRRRARLQNAVEI